MSFLSDKGTLEIELGKNMVLMILLVFLVSKLFTSSKEQMRCITFLYEDLSDVTVLFIKWCMILIAKIRNICKIHFP